MTGSDDSACLSLTGPRSITPKEGPHFHPSTIRQGVADEIRLSSDHIGQRGDQSQNEAQRVLAIFQKRRVFPRPFHRPPDKVVDPCQPVSLRSAPGIREPVSSGRKNGNFIRRLQLSRLSARSEPERIGVA